MLAIGLEVEADDVFAFHLYCGSGQLGIRGAPNTRFAVAIF
jgi:hypothetical protein